MTISTPEELQKLEAVGRIVANCLAYLKARTRAGMTTLEIDDLATAFLAKEGALSAPRSEYKFPGTVCISVEREAAHGIPSDRIIRDGDLVNIDVSAKRDGFFADNGESFVVGRGNKLKRKLCTEVERALMAAIKSIRTGSRIAHVGQAVEQVARSAGFTVIENLCGHGVGKSLHEAPKYIPSYYDPKDKRVFKRGQVVAIEPFLSNGGSQVDEAADGWTLYLDRHYAAQKEHTVVVTDEGAKILTLPSRTY